MLRIISANLNGIRSAVKKGFLPWVTKQGADFVCLQELKAQRDDLEDAVLNPDGLHGFFHHAQKKGYSGCGIYTPHQPDDVLYGFGNEEFDAEGRYVEARFKNLSILSVYMPSGSSSPERQEAKFRCGCLSNAGTQCWRDMLYLVEQSRTSLCKKCWLAY